MTARSAERAWAVDTSVAVAALDETHIAHPEYRAAAMEHKPALSGHAAFETYSVLTRLPGALRLTPATALRVVRRAFPVGCWLTPAEQARTLERLGELRLAGGAAYDALVGQAALSRSRVLLTRDRRAQRTYELLGVVYEFVGE